MELPHAGLGALTLGRAQERHWPAGSAGARSQACALLAWGAPGALTSTGVPRSPGPSSSLSHTKQSLPILRPSFWPARWALLQFRPGCDPGTGPLGIDGRAANAGLQARLPAQSRTRPERGFGPPQCDPVFNHLPPRLSSRAQRHPRRRVILWHGETRRDLTAGRTQTTTFPGCPSVTAGLSRAVHSEAIPSGETRGGSGSAVSEAEEADR